MGVCISDRSLDPSSLEDKKCSRIIAQADEMSILGRWPSISGNDVPMIAYGRAANGGRHGISDETGKGSTRAGKKTRFCPGRQTPLFRQLAFHIRPSDIHGSSISNLSGCKFNPGNPSVPIDQKAPRKFVAQMVDGETRLGN